ncbi:MAG: M28 family peptidase [Bacteroidales bacterium]|nr:M28 family peptidase [Bacteroidales bacterium]
MKNRFTRVVLVVGCMLMSSVVSWGQDTLYARYVINTLTSKQLHGRGAAYRGDSLAANFIAKELARFGAQPLGDNFFQPYTYATHSMEGECSLSLDGKRLRPFFDFKVAAFSCSYNGVLGETPLMQVPIQVLTDTVQMVRFLRRNKHNLSKSVLYIDISQRADNAEVQRLVRQMRHRNPFGCKAILLGVEQLGTSSLGQADVAHNYVLVEVLAHLVPKRVSDVNLVVNTQYRPQYATRNVWALFPGESDSIVVVSAHYDHLGRMGDDVFYPGAHDNASGVAAALSMARELRDNRPRYTTVFLFCSGEEAGLYGSRYAATHPLVDLARVRLLLNIDMFCGGDEGLMVFNAKAANTQPFVSRLQTLNSVLHIAPELRLRENRPNSDHYPFSSLVPSLYVLTMGGPYGGYHSPEDVSTGCGLQNFSNYVTLISSLLL